MSTFPRPNLEDAFWRALESGSHLLLPGPRRIGKTTLLKQALAQPRTDFFPVYVFVESIDSVDELYRKLLSSLLDQEFVGRLSRASRRFSTWVGQIRIEEIGSKVRFGAVGPLDHLDEFIRFCRTLELDGRILLMVDELPQAVENTLGSKSEQERREAIRMLQTLRDCRHDPALTERIQFVFAGSIGLENVAASLGATKHINDLTTVRIPPLTPDEGRAFLNAELTRLGLAHIPQQVREHLLGRIGWDWLIPIFIKRLAEELPPDASTPDAVDQAFTTLLTHQNLFEHWYGRLRMTLDPGELQLVKAMLGYAADPRNNGIHSRSLTNLAVEHGLLEHQVDLVGILKHDGYLNNQEDPARYRFNSPVIREWWWRNVAN
ncbi:AAA family ATPase [Thiocapsa rosea]|uniref:AAA domain-containing protein n=1 Tax=Thiocapsa rosea TaxID=69360 RepID=A0A495VHP6_9GAMM|nr:AAA family ATPase [Thiocapsa rosea]RKT47378.1 AAA domain-containing protein [Thiocapsa rosea]